MIGLSKDDSEAARIQTLQKAVEDLDAALRNIEGAKKAIAAGDTRLTENYLKTVHWRVEEAKKKVVQVGQQLTGG